MADVPCEHASAIAAALDGEDPGSACMLWDVAELADAAGADSLELTLDCRQQWAAVAAAARPGGLPGARSLYCHPRRGFPRFPNTEHDALTHACLWIVLFPSMPHVGYV